MFGGLSAGQTMQKGRVPCIASAGGIDNHRGGHGGNMRHPAPDMQQHTMLAEFQRDICPADGGKGRKCGAIIQCPGPDQRQIGGKAGQDPGDLCRDGCKSAPGCHHPAARSPEPGAVVRVINGVGPCAFKRAGRRHRSLGGCRNGLGDAGDQHEPCRPEQRGINIPRPDLRRGGSRPAIQKLAFAMCIGKNEIQPVFARNHRCVVQIHRFGGPCRHQRRRKGIVADA